jgi:hypothetical protein
MTHPALQQYMDQTSDLIEDVLEMESDLTWDLVKHHSHAMLDSTETAAQPEWYFCRYSSKIRQRLLPYMNHSLTHIRRLARLQYQLAHQLSP